MKKSDAELLALRFAWHRAGDGVRRKWLAEIMRGAMFASRKKKRSAALAGDRPDASILKFLSERTVRRSGSRVQAKVLLAEYNAWASASGEPQRTPQLFGRHMRQLGMSWIMSHNIFYLGIELRRLKT